MNENGKLIADENLTGVSGGAGPGEGPEMDLGQKVEQIIMDQRINLIFLVSQNHYNICVDAVNFVKAKEYAKAVRLLNSVLEYVNENRRPDDSFLQEVVDALQECIACLT